MTRAFCLWVRITLTIWKCRFASIRETGLLKLLVDPSYDLEMKTFGEHTMRTWSVSLVRSATRTKISRAISARTDDEAMEKFAEAIAPLRFDEFSDWVLEIRRIDRDAYITLKRLENVYVPRKN